MTSILSCPFCGVELESKYHRDEWSQPRITRIRPWYAEVRGIYLPYGANSSISITGLGILNRLYYLSAPLSSDLSYLDVKKRELREWELGPRCFGVHESCWKLLLLRLGLEPENPSQNEAKKAIAESVYYHLLCTPWPEPSSFAFDHDWPGAAQVNRASRDDDPPTSFYADPSNIPHEDELGAVATVLEICNGLQRMRLEGTCPPTTSSTAIDHPSSQGIVASRSVQSSEAREEEACTTPPEANNCLFGLLSPELGLEILSYFSFEEVLGLRLVCRDAAMLAAPDTLPRSYWRSRFCIGQEYDFLFLNPTASRDWSSLFFGARMALKGVLSVVNRKRIRRLLEPIASLVELHAAQQNGLYGYVLRRSSRGPGYQLWPDGMDVKLVRTFSGQVTMTNQGRLRHGSCRVIHIRGLPLMPPRQHQWIGISTIKLGTQTFISGINLSQQKKAGLVGYHIPASEKWIEIVSCKSRVESIQVAFCSDGLTGIEFVFENSHTSGWVGDNSGPGIAQGTLSIPGSIGRFCLVASLDNMKIVSLGIGTFTDSTEIPDPSRHRARDGSDSSLVQSHLWTSHSPSEKAVAISEIVPFRSVPVFDPLTNVDFGGPGGQLLGTLTRMTFYMESSPSPLTGIEIFYTDSCPLLFGSRGGCEISCFFNGSKGERITQIGAFDKNGGYWSGGICWSKDHRKDGLIGLQVSTNYGRIVTIVPLPDRLSASPELTPFPSLSDTITGFVFLGKAYKNRFTRVGCQSQKCDQPTIPDVLDRKFHHIPNEQIRYDQKATHFVDGSVSGSYQTYASLKNVRSIQASIGAQGRARPPGYISGLKIEYHNHPSPGVLGQWISELDDVFEVSPDEDIHSLSVWLAPVGFSKECRGVEVRQVAAIHIETTHSRSVTFRSPEYQGYPDDILHYRYERRDGGDINAISWIFNIRSDCIRAVASSKAQSTPKMLPGQVPPFDQTQKIYFSFEKQGHDGENESLVMAEAHFRTKRIVGLLFTYSSGSTASMGDLDTPSRQTVHFEPDSRIVGLSVAGKGDTVVEIEFQAESNEGPSSKKFKASVDSLQDPASTNTDTNPFIGNEDWRDTWCTDTASAQKCRAELSSFIDRVYELPTESKLVGVYAGSHRFSKFGALYV